MPQPFTFSIALQASLFTPIPSKLYFRKFETRRFQPGGFAARVKNAGCCIKDRGGL